MNRIKVLIADDRDNFRRIIIAFIKTQKDI